MRTRLIYSDGREREIEAECAAMLTVVDHDGEHHFAVCQVGVYKEVRHPTTIRVMLRL